MTKLSFVVALSIAALAAPAFAQQGPQGHHAGMTGGNDPCILGMNSQPGTCVGPVRVAPMIMSTGAVAPRANYAPPVLPPAQPEFGPDYAPAVMVAPVQMAGCVPSYGGPTVPCNGVWVRAGNDPQQSMSMPAPIFAPTPNSVQAPVYVPAPMIYAPQIQQIEFIPTSFFTGGITYGAGFPIESAYSYGGGGYAYSSSGTRFSGVRERSPTPLIPPQRPRPHAPPSHHGCNC